MLDFSLEWNPPKINKKLAEFLWNEDYASAVHNGGYSDETFLYPRPWTEEALKRYINVLECFIKYFQESEDFEKAFKELTEELKDAFKQALDTPIYQYPTMTWRKNGSVVTSPRSVTDTGQLRDSLLVTIK